MEEAITATKQAAAERATTSRINTTVNGKFEHWLNGPLTLGMTKIKCYSKRGYAVRRDHTRTVIHLQRVLGIDPLCMMLVFLLQRFSYSLWDCKIMALGITDFFIDCGYSIISPHGSHIATIFFASPNCRRLPVCLAATPPHRVVYSLVYSLVCISHFLRLAIPHTSPDPADPCLLSACTVRCKSRPLSLT